MKSKKSLWMSFVFLAAVVLWTVLVSFVDVKAIGPMESYVGFATLNGFFHNVTGVHMWMYVLTDWLSIIPLMIIGGFAMLGVGQLIKRKSLIKVDGSILALGGFYGVVMAAFLLFETLVINYRPVLIEGVLEASYPSSTTMLVMCVIPTAVMQLNARIKPLIWRRIVGTIMYAYMAFMVIFRLISGVHWFTDIVGGALLSAALVLAYSFVVSINEK